MFSSMKKHLSISCGHYNIDRQAPRLREFKHLHPNKLLTIYTLNEGAFMNLED